MSQGLAWCVFTLLCLGASLIGCAATDAAREGKTAPGFCYGMAASGLFMCAAFFAASVPTLI
jgi:hypothetical protein